MKELFKNLYKAIAKMYEEQFGFTIKDTTFMKIVDYLHMPKDPSSLAVTRILFGLAMLIDIPDERGGATMDRRWGDPKTCHFPLLPFVQALPMPYMALIHAAMWFGALGVMLGYKYHISSPLFTICYWYLFLIEKSFWNNHSYLFGLVGLLLTCTQAHCYWSIDACLDPTQCKSSVPYWNYFVLKYQFFILYFMAGLKKGTAEWLTGYSVQNLSEHWVFSPFKFFLTVPQIDYLVVHWFVFAFDLTVAIWMMWSRTRHVAMLFCALFHLMNSRLFRIGMFPWVCLATMPLFYPFDWPKNVLCFLKKYFLIIQRKITQWLHTFQTRGTCNYKTNDTDDDFNDDFQTSRKKMENIFDNENIDVDGEDIDLENVNQRIYDKNQEYYRQQAKMPKIDCATIKSNKNCVNEEITDKTETRITEEVHRRKKVTTCVIFIYMLMQAFLPYSHFITKGYNNWTNGLYGYSWDMMVHTWDTNSIVVKVVDNKSHQHFFIDPSFYTLNDRWTRHGDMVYQYAHCVKENLLKEIRERISEPNISENISIYLDVWSSMNGRFTQRLFDPKVDMLKASWSPFMEVSYLMPILDGALDWRSVLAEIREEIYAWDNYSEVIFLADFPGYDQEKFIPHEMKNVTLTILEGQVAFEPELTDLQDRQSYLLTKGDQIKIDSNAFHRVQTIGDKPAYYMYNFINQTEVLDADVDKTKFKAKLPIFRELAARLKNMMIFANLVSKSVFQMFF